MNQPLIYLDNLSDTTWITILLIIIAAILVYSICKKLLKQ